MTPLQIEMLLHYHTRYTDYPDRRSSAQTEALKYFVDHGFLVPVVPAAPSAAPSVPDARAYKPTPKLHAYCEALCRVPEPRQEWVVDMEIKS